MAGGYRTMGGGGVSVTEERQRMAARDRRETDRTGAETADRGPSPHHPVHAGWGHRSSDVNVAKRGPLQGWGVGGAGVSSCQSGRGRVGGGRGGRAGAARRPVNAADKQTDGPICPRRRRLSLLTGGGWGGGVVYRVSGSSQRSPTATFVTLFSQSCGSVWWFGSRVDGSVVTQPLGGGRDGGGC